jgi:hypothetical protein
MKNDPKEKENEILDLDITLMDGLDEDDSFCNWDDEYDNNLGDLILF